ncbi:MAG TPA: YqiA/YcfP family alpha/beta fold hydrolase [Spongiibacteraceae bacterium]|nr:YqiA/YcfP family alpha/beta fold hydrolase [Spongiibacteraceae bacterium]
MTTTIIYLHGFLSSPQSAKARLVGDYLQARAPRFNYVVPALPEEPGCALAAAERAVLEQRLAGKTSIALIGSSMGGFYATVLAQRHGLRAVLINPSVRPHSRIHQFFGENSNPYSGRRFVLNATHADELAQMASQCITETENFWLLVQSGDLVLDYREAVQFYAGCKQTVEQGGDHQFQGFERYLPDIVDFLTR